MIEVTTNVPKGMAVQPDIMVMTLYGKGVIPATSTAQKPKSLNRVLNSAIESALPRLSRMGLPMLS